MLILFGFFIVCPLLSLLLCVHACVCVFVCGVFWSQFKEFVKTYDRLVELQKEKVRSQGPESAKEYVAGKAPSEFQLVPQKATEGPVLNAKWVHEGKYSLLLREKVLSWSGGKALQELSERKQSVNWKPIIIIFHRVL